MYTFQIPKMQGMTEHVLRETVPNCGKRSDSEENGQKHGLCDEEIG